MAAVIARVLDGALRQVDGTDQEAIRVGTPAWWRWLDVETTRSFAFHGPSGHFTARKARRRGGMYWTAYRKVAGQLLSVYLGKSPALSAERLEEVAAQLSERAARNERGRRPPALLTSVPLIGASPAVLTTDILRALALAAQGDRPAALEALECALRAGAPEGYVRRFLDEGAPLAVLLRQIQSSTAVPNYVAMLLADSGGAGKAASPDPPQGGAHALVEPLSGRELEVLRLLAAGRGTGAIAQELIVSEGTVKRHIGNIMGKLDVHSRLEAVARARSLGLVT